MNQTDSGNIIRTMRQEKGMTQNQLADKLGISDKAVSKWERGIGMPDISLLPELSRILGADIEYLLSGGHASSKNDGGNMKNTKFYVCPTCGTILTASTSNAAISCCGKILEPLIPEKSDDAHSLIIENIETDIFIHCEHEMTKQHYIAFAALLSGGTLTIHRLYPEWNMQARFVHARHGTLLWYCTEHGLFYKRI